MFNSNGRGSNNRGRDGATSHAASPGTSGKRGMFSVIGPDVTITGNIAATADLHIDGQVDGDVHCGALVQSADSRIAGNVTAETARIAGTIDGRVAVRQLTVERGARVTGDVEYENISIENGATIDGHLRHKSPGTLKLAEAPAPSPAVARNEQLLLQGDVAA